MESFSIIQPSELLAPYIRHYWTLDASASQEPQRIIPTGCMQLVLHRGSRLLSVSKQSLQPSAFLCGQGTTYSDLAQTGSVSMVVVVFQPFGARAFFDIPMNELSGQNVGFDELNDPLLNELYEKVAAESDAASCVWQIEQALLQRLRRFTDYSHKRLLAVVGQVNRSSSVSAAALAETACLSYRQFNRMFSSYVGVAPKEFLRVVRFQRALYYLQHNPSISFTQLAYACGFYDQPHMVREFQSLSGLTPGQLVALCPPHSDYFS